MQVKDLTARQSAYEEECGALRNALSQLQVSSDETVETGTLQWAVLQARRAEGEAKRREANAIGRRNHVQATLFKLQLATENNEAALQEAQTALRAAEAEAARARSALIQRDAETTQMRAEEAVYSDSE